MLKNFINFQFFYKKDSNLDKKFKFDTVHNNIIFFDISLCDGCLKCEKICPQNTIFIEIKEDNSEKTIEKFYTDYTRCINCGDCINICPQKAINMLENDQVFSPYIENFLIKWVNTPIKIEKNGIKQTKEGDSLDKFNKKIENLSKEPLDRFPEQVKPPKIAKRKFYPPIKTVGNRVKRG